MTTLAKIIITTLFTLLICSCNVNISTKSVQGNGNVTTEIRPLDNSFTAIKVSKGIEVYITQNNDTPSITVEADENLHEIIITTVENNVLRIYAEDNISSSQSKKVMLNFNDLSKITTTSGSYLSTTNNILVTDLELKSTSGSKMTIDVTAQTIGCKSTSGSHLQLLGTTTHLNAQVTSGSQLAAQDLKSEITQIKSTSGSSANVNVTSKITAKATSGASITYQGNPEHVEVSNNVSGSIKSI